MRQLLEKSPTATRVLPFAIFVGLTACQGHFFNGSEYWVYLIKTLLGAWMLSVIWPYVPEARWKFSLEAFGVGTLIAAVWVGLDGYYPSLAELGNMIGIGSGTGPLKDPDWNPLQNYSSAPALGWFFVVVRLVGSTLVVPPLEELFYRSFLYRSLISPNFEQQSLRRIHSGAFVLSAIVFGFAHREWLPGIICAMAYQALVIRHGRLGEAMTAHATTNLLLGLWVVWRGDWKFW